MLLRPLQKQVCSISFRRQFSNSTRIQAHVPRFYRYAVDVHGQLFLHDTKPKNLTSCFKNPQFLDFFFARIKPNKLEETSSNCNLTVSERDKEILQDPEWTERKNLTLEEATRLAILDDYNWVSPCQGELNFIRAAKSPIVFRELDQDGEYILIETNTLEIIDFLFLGTLRWGGSFTDSFDPSSLKVDPETGYVYHPSPISPLRSAREKVKQGGLAANSYGEYSLLSSALVLQRLATGLDVDPEAFQEGKGGSIEWEGKRWDMGIITGGVELG